MNQEEDYLTAASALLGLPIQPAHKAEVLAAFTVLREQGRMVTAFELPDETEQAPRFIA